MSYNRQHEAIEVDPAILFSDDDTYESSGYSLNSAVDRYIFENGRRYHAYYGVDKNLMPTDEMEQDRLDLHHEIMLQLLDGDLHLAPLEDPRRILDIGTGTGIWAIDAADRYPKAKVIGTDLSPIQPAWVPENCKFEVDDAEQEWLYPPDYFDFIHARNLAQAIENWPILMEQAYHCTKPGGYVEIAELGAEVFSDDNTLSENNGFKRYLEYIDKAFVKLGRPQCSAQTLRQNLENAGFVDVQVSSFKQPFGPWANDRRMKHIGAMVLLMSETGLEAYGMAPFTRVLEMPQAEAMRICRDGVIAVKNKNHHMYSYL
ncbi:UMTA methyltransferase family protein [Wilcoxina mikolae CBS 423.85]|nr:UMTA methyltransferase family protein [Wilcoxina mikolae CBS 423.85]